MRHFTSVDLQVKQAVAEMKPFMCRGDEWTYFLTIPSLLNLSQVYLLSRDESKNKLGGKWLLTYPHFTLRVEGVCTH